MFGRGVAAAVCAILLSGCASDRTGADYLAVSQRIGQPRPGQSRIIVLSEKGRGFGAAGCAVTLDGRPIGKVQPGTYVFVDAPVGRHEIVGTQTLFPGDTKREVNTESGRTYFFLLKNSQRADTLVGVTLVAGLAGALVASAATSGSDNPGPVDFIPLDPAAARATLADLQLAE